MAKVRKTFKQAVESTPEVATAYRAGLTALGAYSAKIRVANRLLLQGSVDIDAATVKLYPNQNRWDYALAYDSKVYFVEVHSANTSEVRVVLRKLAWLKNWLHAKAPEINKLKAESAFYWIQSSNFQIPKNSPQYLASIRAGIKPIPLLVL